MAATKDKATDEVARGNEDVALKLAQAGPRDALVDPQPGDIIPDNEEKGYHIGEVRQPAEPVLHRSGDVTFESEGESKFAGASIGDLKAAHNKREASDEAYAGVVHVPDADLGETRSDDRLTRSQRASRSAPAKADDSGVPSAVSDKPPRGSVTEKLDRDSAAVAEAQAREDKS